MSVEDNIGSREIRLERDDIGILFDAIQEKVVKSSTDKQTFPLGLWDSQGNTLHRENNLSNVCLADNITSLNEFVEDNDVKAIDSILPHQIDILPRASIIERERERGGEDQRL